MNDRKLKAHKTKNVNTRDSGEKKKQEHQTTNVNPTRMPVKHTIAEVEQGKKK